jgi:hypothetical protein
MNASQEIARSGAKDRRLFRRFALLLALLAGAYQFSLAVLDQIDSSGFFVLAGGLALALAFFLFIYVPRSHARNECKTAAADQETARSIRALAAD